MNQVLEELGKIGLVPVITIDDAEKAVPLAGALMAGGIPCAEVTFRTAQGEEALRRIAAEAPGILAGAGTVLTADQVDRAAAAGAKFIVSPGLNPKVVSRCREKGIPVIPGCTNPSDMERALELGLEAVKFFPAEQAGGLDYIKAVAAPYPGLKFMPTGGINARNIAAYIAFDQVLACGGSWMAGADLIKAGDFEKITALCREAVWSLFGFSVAHVGINVQNGDEARGTVKLLEALFGFAPRPGVGGGSVFSGEGIEVMNPPGPGTRGHIAVRTNSIARARAFLERAGFSFRPETAKTDAKGALYLIYLKDEIAGFAVHLVQKR
jgi:2-dehydro-3-deoxyphosphogluconate aldolase/(4S)-4-hydroxy-2-oxoglutarate aldolase